MADKAHRAIPFAVLFTVSVLAAGVFAEQGMYAMTISFGVLSFSFGLSAAIIAAPGDTQ